MSVGDTLEVLIPDSIENFSFEIKDLYDIETEERIDTINPGRKGQQVIITIPCTVEKGYVIRRKK